MRELNIDFAPKTLCHQLLNISIITIMLVVALTLIFGTFLEHYLALEGRKSVIESEIHNTTALRFNLLKEMTPSAPTPIPDAKKLTINHAIAKLNMPWSDLFDQLEHATSPNVALLSILPNAEKFQIKGVAETKTTDDMIDYIERLKKETFFTNVMIEKHEVNEQDINHPIRFQFSAQWRPQ
ncbi:PilN domain-containing protein [Undibacterium sp. Dicai25W]|uniref:PilN domain-containing protein n=1 Tax=Undibacterium sp. Dicai25W TaxID=3413034 RepID=UPI003BF2F053